MFTKRTWFYIFFALSFMFSMFGNQEQNVFIPQAKAMEFASNIYDLQIQEAELRQQEKQLMVKAIRKIYKRTNLEEVTRVVDYAYQYSEAYSVPPFLLIGLIATESAFRRLAVSKEGAAGYTQVLAKHHRDKIKGRNIFRTDVNIEVGTIILSDCMVKHKNVDGALGCYNGTTNPVKIAKFKQAIEKRKDQILVAAHA